MYCLRRVTDSGKRPFLVRTRRMRFSHVSISMVAGALASTQAVAQRSLPDSVVRRIDAMYARYSAPEAPGCALGVFQNGAITLAKGYGAANIEYGVPITPSTPFIMGSVSKQFTAAAIALLV